MAAPSGMMRPRLSCQPRHRASKEHPSIDHIIQELAPAILLLSAGILSVALTRPLRLSPIVGYLLAGIAIGPHVLALVPEDDTTRLLAELGVVFLLFDIGLHFSLSHLWEARKDIFGLGPLQVVLCAVALGAVSLAVGFDPVHAVVIGTTLALSSTAVVVQTLAERGQQNCPVGLTATAIMVFQDVCAIFLLIFATSLESAKVALLPTFAGAVLNAAIAFVAAVLIARYVIGPMFNVLSRTRNDEIFTAIALFIVLVTATATGEMGLSLTLGAFLGGMIISETAYRPVVQSEVRPFRALLLGFFFITVGMSLDPAVLSGHWAEILLFLAGLIAIKTALVASAALFFGWSVPGSIQLGSLIAQGSEFAFVIFSMPAIRGALGEDAAAVMIAGIAISLALTPTLAAIGRSAAGGLRRRLAVVPPAEVTPRETATPVLIFGMGEIGRTVADALEAHEIPYEAIEMDHDRFVAANADGYRVAFGDIGDPRLWESVEMGERKAIVVTIVRYDVAAALTPIIRERYPNLIRFVTVDDDREVARFAALGMRPVVSRSVPRGLELAAAVLAALGVPEDKIAKWMQREQDRALGPDGSIAQRVEAA